MISAADKAKLIRDPGNVSAMYDAVHARLGSIGRMDVVPFLDRLRAFGDLGRRAAYSIERHFDQLDLGTSENARLIGLPSEVRVVEFGETKLRYAHDDFASRTFFSSLMKDGQVHELGVIKLLMRSLESGDIFVDVGAHTGYLSCLAGVRGAIVFAFELQPTIGPIIRRNALINGLDQVHVFTAAAGARDGITSVLRYQPTLSGRAYDESDGRESAVLGNPQLDWVPVMRLDTLAADLPKPPKLVKIDGEGSELQILEGARDLIARRETRFVLEFHVSLVAEFGGRHEDVYPFFPPEHWRVYKVEDTGLRSMEAEDLRTLLAPAAGRKTNPILLFDPIRP